MFNTGSEGSEELQYSAVHDGDLKKSHPEVEGTVVNLLCAGRDGLTSHLAFLSILCT